MSREAAPACGPESGLARPPCPPGLENSVDRTGRGKGITVAILHETRSRPVLVHLCELAAHDLGADFCMIQMPTPPQTAPVPEKSTGTSWANAGNRAVIGALKQVDVIVDCTVEGLIHAPEWPEIEAAGGTQRRTRAKG